MINAFHPEYVQTHMPTFMDTFRTHDARREAAEALSQYVTKKRRTKPSHGSLPGISKAQRETVPNQQFQDISAFPKTRRRESMKSLVAGKKMTLAEVAAELAPRGFHTYSKAGYPKKKINPVEPDKVL
jgi:hypothetical protein